VNISVLVLKLRFKPDLCLDTKIKTDALSDGFEIKTTTLNLDEGRWLRLLAH